MITHWMQKDGTRIRIVDMSDMHLINSIAMLERFAYQAWVQAISSGPPSFNGEMAQYYAEQTWDQLIEDGPEYPPIYDALCAERDKRETKPKPKLKGKRK